MCENSTEWGPSEWAGIIQALVALASAYLLYKTLKSQKEATETSKAVAEMDKKAKRAEYLPEIRGLALKPIFPKNNWYKDESKLMDENGFPVTFFDDIYGGRDSQLTIRIFFEKNHVQIYKLNIDKKGKHFEYNTRNMTNTEKDILKAGDFLEITFTINMMNYFNVKPWESSLELIDQVSDDPDYRDQFCLSGEIYFKDLLGNKYKFNFSLEKYDQLTLSNIKMID